MPLVLGGLSFDVGGAGEVLRELFADVLSFCLARDAAVDAADTGTLGLELRSEGGGVDLTGSSLMTALTEWLPFGVRVGVLT